MTKSERKAILLRNLAKARATLAKKRKAARKTGRTYAARSPRAYRNGSSVSTVGNLDTIISEARYKLEALEDAKNALARAGLV